MKSIRVRRECACGMKFELEVERELAEFVGDVQRDTLRIADEWQKEHIHWDTWPRITVVPTAPGAHQ